MLRALIVAAVVLAFAPDVSACHRGTGLLGRHVTRTRVSVNVAAPCPQTAALLVSVNVGVGGCANGGRVLPGRTVLRIRR